MYMGWYRCFYLVDNYTTAAGDSLIEVQREAERSLAVREKKLQLGHFIDIIPSLPRVGADASRLDVKIRLFQ